MPPLEPPANPRWYLIPVRVAVVTFLITLLSFAVSLLLGIVAMVIAARLHGTQPNMTFAYRHIALPAAGVVAVIALSASTALEIRQYRRAKTLAQLERMND